MNGQSAREAEAESGTNLYHSRLVEANQVLDWAPDLVPNVVAGVHQAYQRLPVCPFSETWSTETKRAPSGDHSTAGALARKRLTGGGRL
jgi:hypothetical protein